MLTGRPPIKGETQAETIKLVLEEDPVTPSQLRPNVSFDLETICLKCIARDPRKRYASALGLAEDLDRFLEGEPILARRTPLWERAIKLCTKAQGERHCAGHGHRGDRVSRWLVSPHSQTGKRPGRAKLQAVQQKQFVAQDALATGNWPKSAGSSPVCRARLRKRRTTGSRLYVGQR